MDQIADIIKEVEAFARTSGVTPATVCRKATGNPRLFDRLLRRREQTGADIERLRAFMGANAGSVPE